VGTTVGGEESGSLVGGEREGLQSVDVVLAVTVAAMDLPAGHRVQPPLPAASLYEPERHLKQVRKPPATLPPKPAEHVQVD